MTVEGQAKNRRAPTIRQAMFAVAVIAVVLGVVANERWRWGFPLRVPFERGNAVNWLERLAHDDWRKYDRADVTALLSYVADEGLLNGQSKEQIERRLGIPFASSLPFEDGQPIDHFYQIGIGPLWNGPGPPEFRCCFDADGRCIRAVAPYSRPVPTTAP